MEFKSIHEVLQFALSKEEASVQFYRELAGRMQNPASRRLAESLAQQETSHVQMIALEMNKQGFCVRANEQLEDKEFIWDEHLQLDDEARNMNPVEIMAMAIQKERAAFQLYAQLLGLAHDIQFRTMLMDLAEEEVRHILLLEQQYEILIHEK
ncbi:MAG TPA: ferritin family protein [Anaerohalosphaeraceae bacterium]|nr:ferritin family protein [Anaerohalosphaeraceae bacterium]HOL31565.1 ferritin family protein [Anaerohalosphaeraceae bacterium]HOM75992.1 ferritin family protein [Anaerohalosphaeraceae bacterium]HPC63767.1 ferritin family protein [Anaerohalosphaeraceae bacterium]HPO69832.1 ferritin family protein [Anaerohalosphaeraceae bacterium]